MGKRNLKFEIVDPRPEATLTHLVKFHTKTLKIFFDIVRKSPEKNYKIIYNGQRLLVNYLAVKEVLSTREHVLNKKESKVLRQLKQKQ